MSTDDLRGRTLAHYEITEKLGEGGMGAVYLARDTKLGRQVALKILPSPFADDEERLARFHREARTLAALNHPNIAAIHGLESDQGVHFLAMELAEGEDLAARLRRGPVPVDEAVGIARDIARGLEEAHQTGIIHRDLKPANVKVSDEGKVKVLDFGLARAFQGESTAEEATLDSPTLTAAMTQAGVILGTAAYMSPEQARGTGVDRRTDIWSFGVVLYEMLTGRRPFEGETVSDTLAGILKTDPDWDALPEGTPDNVRLLLVRCLERDRTQRLQDIGEARILLSDRGASTLLSGMTKAVPAAAAAPAPGRGRGATLGLALAALAVGLALGALAVRALLPGPPPPPTRRLDVAMPAGTTSSAVYPRISPDGTMAVYVLEDRLWLRRLDTGTTTALPGTEEGNYPFWSPDSRHIGFFVGTTIRRVGVDGGAPLVVCSVPGDDRGTGGTWDTDDRMLFTTGDESGILAVPARGGNPVSVILPDSTIEQDFHDPHALGDGRGLLVSSHLKNAMYTHLYHLKDGARVLLFDGGEHTVTSPAWCESGHVLFRLEGTNGGVWALPYDPDAMQARGDPFLVVGGGNWPSVSADRTLLCATGDADRDWQLVELDRAGGVVAPHGEPQDLAPFFALDPAGTRAALSVVDGEETHLWVLDLARGTQSRLTFDDGRHTVMAWFPDGQRMANTVAGGGGVATFMLELRSVEGSEPPRLLGGGLFPEVTPDGEGLLCAYYHEGSMDLGVYDLTGVDAATTPTDSTLPDPVVTDPQWQYGPQLSPDGRLLAYTSRETGRDEVYMRRYPEGDRKRQISADGGAWPMWGPEGDRLYYMSGLDLVEVAVTREPSVMVGAPEVLFTRPSGRDRYNVGWPLYFQVSRDGEHFYMLYEQGDDAGGRPLMVVEEWVGEFQGR